MSRAYGWNARLLLGFENTYGQAPASGEYHLIPFISSNLDSEQGLIESNILGLGREPSAPFQDVINVDGDIVIPMDLRNIGYWLKALFGSPATSGASPYSHEFVSGETELPSMSIELGLPNVPDYPLFTGVRANSCSFNFQRSGEAQITISLMAQGETAGTSTRDASPAEVIYTRFSQFQGSIKKGGVALADVTAASLTYSNNLEKIETIRDDGMIDGIDAGICSLSGSITARYSTPELINLARAGTPIDLELAYTIDDDNKLVLQCHEVYLPKPKRSINGPGGVEATYEFQGAKEDTLGKMLTVTLVNDIEEI